MKVGDPWYSVYFVMQLCFILKQEWCDAALDLVKSIAAVPYTKSGISRNI